MCFSWEEPSGRVTDPWSYLFRRGGRTRGRTEKMGPLGGDESGGSLSPRVPVLARREIPSPEVEVRCRVSGDRVGDPPTVRLLVLLGVTSRGCSREVSVGRVGVCGAGVSTRVGPGCSPQGAPQTGRCSPSGTRPTSRRDLEGTTHFTPFRGRRVGDPRGWTTVDLCRVGRVVPAEPWREGRRRGVRGHGPSLRGAGRAGGVGASVFSGRVCPRVGPPPGLGPRGFRASGRRPRSRRTSALSLPALDRPGPGLDPRLYSAPDPSPPWIIHPPQLRRSGRVVAVRGGAALRGP